MTPKQCSVTEELREALASCGLSRYEVARQTGLSQAVLSRFARGGELISRNVDLLCLYLGLRLVPMSGKRERED
ncbi:MAG: helix-turn-helix transcriptional regulator [Planctomycetota bacterium]